jgi:hypothetical protein
MSWTTLKAASWPGAAAVPSAIAAALVLAGAIGVATPATQALAAQSASHHPGTFKSWGAAQRAAGFKLLQPTRTYKHVRNGDIVVARCEVKKPAGRRVVTASYGLTPFSVLAISQNNAGLACMQTGKVKTLGSYKINGTKAVLTGKCGLPGLRPCTSLKVLLMLTWTRHGNYYVASSFGLPRKTLVGFATGLRPVR